MRLLWQGRSMSQIEQLRRLLLTPEMDRLDRQEAEVASLRCAQESLPERLPDLFSRSQQLGQGELLGAALAPIVERSLFQSVQSRPETIVAALFPVIGPAIRKAITEALRGFAEEVNRAVENSLSLRGLKWRVEAWRSGVPFSQIVVRNSLRYAIDHVFLIERESGLLLHRFSSTEHAEADGDAIAGMLTAIGDFVIDSVGDIGAGGDGLSEASVGEHLLLVQRGPLAALACFVRGTAPPELRVQLQRLLEEAHQSPGFAGELDDGRWQARLNDGLESIAMAAARSAPLPPQSRWPVWCLLALVLMGLGSLLYLEVRSRTLATALKAHVAAEPGWELLEFYRGSPMRLRLLRDPDATPVEPWLEGVAAADAGLEVVESPYLSLHPELVLRRVARVLQPPVSVQMHLVGSRLVVSGEAGAQWRGRLQQIAMMLPGIESLDSERLSPTPQELMQERFEQLSQRITRTTIRYGTASAELASDEADIAALADAVVEAMQLGDAMGAPVRAEVAGLSDRTGSERFNASVRLLRAQDLTEHLVARGVPDSRIDINSVGYVEQDLPGARVKLALLESRE